MDYVCMSVHQVETKWKTFKIYSKKSANGKITFRILLKLMEALKRSTFSKDIIPSESIFRNDIYFYTAKVVFIIRKLNGIYEAILYGVV